MDFSTKSKADIQILSSLGDLGMFMPLLNKLVETEERNWISSCDCKIWVPSMLCLDECGWLFPGWASDLWLAQHICWTTAQVCKMWFSVSVEWSESSINNNITILMLNIVSMLLHMHNAYISIVRDREGKRVGEDRETERWGQTDWNTCYAENEDFFFSNSEIRWNLSLRVSEIPACQYKIEKMEGWRMLLYQLRKRSPWERLRTNHQECRRKTGEVC